MSAIADRMRAVKARLSQRRAAGLERRRKKAEADAHRRELKRQGEGGFGGDGGFGGFGGPAA